MKIAPFSTRRLEALTDGVFAIAMTLLVLDLAVPVGQSINDSQQLWQVLGPLSGNIVSFAISFAILAIMWGVHVRQFEGIKQIDDRVLIVNNLRLFIVVMIPFTTSLLGEFNNIRLAEFLYPLNLFLLAMVTAYQGRYLAQHPKYFTNFNQPDVEAGRRRSDGFMLTAFVVMIASIFIGSFAYFIFFLGPLFARFIPEHYSDEQ